MESPPHASPSPRFLPLLVVLFLGSGCAALIYEIVWFQLLQLVIGSTAVSLGVLLATFMGGMCAGSLVWPRLVSTSQHPLRVYAMLEFGIGLAGVLILFGAPAVGRLYAVVAGHGYPGIGLRAVMSAICLLPPTFMMGATLPVIARWIESTPRGVSWLGFFYGGNTFGAVVGCLFAGFYLLRVHDVATATFCAAAINGAVALIALALAKFAPHRASGDSASGDSQRVPGSRAVLSTIALSGFCALAAEVVWTRLLSLLLGGTVYAFSIILAVFLTGLGLGSAVGSLLARDTDRPRVLLGGCQILQALGMAWAAYALNTSLPFWPIDQTIGSSPAIHLQMDLVRSAWVILPSAFLWGASFPLALASMAAPGQDPGRMVGTTYAANTVGAIFGSIGAALLLVPLLGTQQTQRVLMGISTVSGLIAFFAFARRNSGAATKWAVTAAVIVLPLGVGFLMRVVSPVPWALVAYGRQLPITSTVGTYPLYIGEGLNSTVGVTQMAGDIRSFHVAGKTEASTLAKDMRLQRMLGHVPAMFHPEPKSVLIVGCGAGVTAGSFVLYPSVKRIVICEIEPLIPKNIAPFFKTQNYDVVNDPRVEIVYDDARHFILTTQEKFDIITSDPIHPWVKGAATLYTAEYFEMCRKRLNPGGLLTQWVPFYESDQAVVQSEIATFFEVFPNGTIWGNDDDGSGYDVVMLGQADPLLLNVDDIQKRFNRPDYNRVRESLTEMGVNQATDMFKTYAGRESELRGWLKGAEINRDRSLRLQYLAGLQLNSYQGMAIYVPMLMFRRFPADIIVGTEAALAPVREELNLLPGL